MARMIPPVPVEKTPPGELRLFQYLRDDPGTEDWTVLHSLNIARHVRQVEGEVDFIVIAPGLGILCVEVKSHRSAHRDATGMWHLGAQPPVARSPFTQAREQMHSIRRFLTGSGIDTSGIPFESAVWFTGARVSGASDSPEWHPWQLLDWRDLSRRPVSQTLASVMARARQYLAQRVPGIASTPGSPTSEQCALLTSRLRPRFEVRITAADIRQIRDQDRQSFLEEQYEALDIMEVERRVLFSGAAGTGKTFLALEAARRASLRGQTVRFLCYNRFLGRWLAREMDSFPGTRAGHLHAALLGIAKVKVPDDQTEYWWRQDLPNLALNVLLERAEQADVLIVDEVQDLCQPAYLDVLDLMVKGGLAGGRWLMFGDFERQSIYGTEDGRPALRERSPEAYVRPLLRNCRNTPRIGRTAAEVSRLGDVYRGFRRPDDGVDVDFASYTTSADQERSLVKALDLLRKDRYANDEIVILSPTVKGIAAKIGESGARSKLGEYGAQDNKIGYATVHAFKGLEAPAIVVTDIDSVTGEQAESLLYVALSRATDRLIVLAHHDALEQMWATVTKGRRL